MNLFFYGAGKNGRIAAKSFWESSNLRDYNVCGFIDGYKEGLYCGMPIVPLESVKSEDIIIISVINCFNVVDIYEKCRKFTTNIYWFNSTGYVYNYSGNFFDSCIDCRKMGRRCLASCGNTYY